MIPPKSFRATDYYICLSIYFAFYVIDSLNQICVNGAYVKL